MFRFILAVLAAWRVTHLLASEDGPLDLIARFRAQLGNGVLGKLMDCFYCLSVWIAAPAALFVTRKPLDWAVTWLAISGGACLLERLGKEPVVIEPIAQPAQKEIPDVLWTEARTDDGQHDAKNDGGEPSAVHPPGKA